MHSGTIHALNVSPGGVPKSGRDSLHVSVHGCEGDAQRDLRHHGGSDRAVSLYSLGLIEALRREGHPIEPGAAR